MRAFLGYRGVVDHQHGIAAAHQLIRQSKRILIDSEPFLCGRRDRIGNRIMSALDAYLS
jgi:hypothetical protein